MYYDCMEDCIHLHACRLLAKRYRNAGSKFVARFCNDECPAYQRMREVCVVSADDACYTARHQYDGPQDPCDAYCAWDFPSFTAYEIENGARCKDEYEDDFNGYAVTKKKAAQRPKKDGKSKGLAKWPKNSKRQKENAKPKKEPYKCDDKAYLASSDACAKAFGEPDGARRTRHSMT